MTKRKEAMKKEYIKPQVQNFLLNAEPVLGTDTNIKSDGTYLGKETDDVVVDDEDVLPTQKNLWDDED